MKKKFLLNGHPVNVAKLDAVILAAICGLTYVAWRLTS